MATDRYSLKLDTTQATAALNGFKNTVLAAGAAFGSAFAVSEIAKVSSNFEDLRTTLGILYKDTATGAKAFDQIKKFAAGSVLQVDQLTETVIKLKAAGLDPTIEQLQLFSDVAAVSADSVGTLQAITDLFARTTEGGLGLEDLNRLADRGIPVFKILGERLNLSRLEIAKFGQTADGAQIILKALTEGLKESFGGASAARVSNLSQAFSNFQDVLEAAFDTIGQSGFNKALGDAIRAVSDFIATNEELIKSIGQGLATAINFVVKNADTLLKIIAATVGAAAAAKVVAFAETFYTLTKAIRSAAVAGLVLQGITGIGLVKALAGLGGAAAGIVAMDKLFEDATKSSEDFVKKVQEAKKEVNEGPILPTDTGGVATETIEQALERIKNKQKEVTVGAISYFKEYKDGVEDLQRNIQQQGELAKLTESQARVQRELNAFTQNYYDTVRPLQQQVIDLKAKDTEESRIQAAEIQKQIGQITTLYEQTKQGLTEQLQLRESITSELEKQKELETTLLEIGKNRRDFEQEMEDTIRGYKRELEDLNLTGPEREIKNVQRMIDDRLVQAIRNVKKEWESGIITADEYIKEIKRLEEIGTKAQGQIEAIVRQQQSMQRSFAYGWRKAFEEYADNATNAAKRAENIFRKATRGMEDLIVNFAKTGKFEWKNFVASMLEELLRAQIQTIFAQLMGSMGDSLKQGGSFLDSLFGGGGGSGGFFSDLLGGIGSIFGVGGGGEKGSSANNPLYVMDVGGSGGGMFGGGGILGGGGGAGQPQSGGGIGGAIGGIWEGVKKVGGQVIDAVGGVLGGIGSGIGTVVNGIGGAIGGVVDTIGGIFGGGGGGGGGGGFFDDIIGGIGDFFGGFFANGGMLGAGKFGIAGENGPELISGPAQITPLTGGANVTYNINAVDAASFKTLLAQDPGFIYGLTLQGSKSVPARR